MILYRLKGEQGLTIDRHLIIKPILKEAVPYVIYLFVSCMATSKFRAIDDSIYRVSPKFWLSSP